MCFVKDLPKFVLTIYKELSPEDHPTSTSSIDPKNSATLIHPIVHGEPAWPSTCRRAVCLSVCYPAAAAGEEVNTGGSVGRPFPRLTTYIL